MSLRSGILLALAYVLVLSVVALLVPLGVSLRDRVDAEIRLEARTQAETVAARAASLLSPPRTRELEALARNASVVVGGRVLIVGRQGRVLADSAGFAETGSRYGTRPEIAAALAGDPGQEIRRSQDLGQEILATAVPVYSRTRPSGAVRVTQSVNDVNEAIRRSWLGLALIGALVIGLGLIAGLVIARLIAGPIVRLDGAARRVADGDLEVRAMVEGSSEQKTLARSFNTMTERLTVLLDSQREFVADASHQLRTPLTGLRLRIEEMRADASAAREKENADAALAEVDRLSLIVDELLELSRAGEAPPPDARADLDRAVVEAGERWKGAAAGAGCRLAVEPGGGGEVRCHATELDRILDILLENAVAYAPGEPVEISSAPGSVTVSDRGPGLQGQRPAELFERFRRGQASRGGPTGTGLGLAIALELAERWGASLELSDGPDGGMAAVLTFPGAKALPSLSPQAPTVEA
ncbi:MAG: sensor histidine kinase [Solirubrobacterales bacterium]